MRRVFTKATNRERGNPQRSENWLMSRRGWFKIYPDRIECGNWRIPSEAVEGAILYRGHQLFVPVSVLEVVTKDATYQFGFNPWVDVEPDLPFPVESKRVSVGYSPFSVAIRILLLIVAAWYVWQHL